MPKHYFRNDDPSADVLVTWKAHAHLFYTNWINYYVYQTTPLPTGKTVIKRLCSAGLHREQSLLIFGNSS